MKDIFSESLYLNAWRSGVPVRVGAWKVHLPRALGFCGGVRNALSVLRNTLENRRERRIWLLGEIIHNDTVNQYVRDRDVTILPEPDIGTIFERALPEDVFVIPAFGVPQSLERRLRAFCRCESQIVDATCGYIKRIWVFAEKMAAERRTILLHGKPDHPEVRATLSRALTPENAVVVLPDLATARRLAAAIRSGSFAEFAGDLMLNREHLDFRNAAIVNQTTMLYEETRDVEASVRDAVVSVGGSVATAATLCRVTRDRQTAALELCRRGCDLILVLGGYSSSNTNQLYRLAKKHCTAYFIRSAAALARDQIEHFLPESSTTATTPNWLPPDVHDIGILAGASCPPCDVDEVIAALRGFAPAS